jgi:hypothetical protein
MSADDAADRKTAATESRRARRWFHRAMFSVMGPPQLGDLSAPVPEPPARDTGTCPRCGRPYAEHEVVREPRLTFTRCP